MSQFFLSFVATSLFMAIAIAAVLAIRTLFPNAFSPNMRYVVWMIILLGLIIPIRPLLGDGIIALQLPFAISTESQAASIPSSTASAGIAASADSVIAAPAQEPLASAASDMGINVLSGLQALSAIEILAIIWATVALVVLFYHAGKYVRFFRLVKRWGSSVNDEETLAVLQAVKTEKGISSKKIALKKCGFMSTSMIVGFFRPLILLPEKDFSTEELEMIFHHELVHYRRGDLFVKLLSVIALSLNWFNPAVYVMNSVMQTDCEASCDQSVITSIGTENKHFYAETIMEMIGYRSASTTVLSTCFYGSKQGIKTRMEAIMGATGTTNKIAIATLVTSIFTLVLVGGLVVFAGSVFAFSGQAQAEVAIADASDTYAADDDFDYFYPSGFYFYQGEDDEVETVFQLEDGTIVRAFVNELGTISVIHDDGSISSTIPRYPPGGTNISSDQAIQIAEEGLAARDITATLDGYDYGWGEGIDISWEFDETWVWRIKFSVQDERMPYIMYLICVDTGDVIHYEWISPPWG